MKQFLPLSTCLISLLMCLPVRAELMGIVPGRGANIPLQATLSIEVGFSWYTKQMQWSAVRFNFKPSSKVIAYFDFANLRASQLPTANARLANFSGTGYGGGLMLVVPDFFTTFDAAFKVAYHGSVIDEAGVRSGGSGAAGMSVLGDQQHRSPVSRSVPMALQQAQWSADFLLSPIDPVFETGLSWYSTLGFVSTTGRTKAEAPVPESTAVVDYRQKSGVAFGIGLVQPMAKGRIYVGFEWLSDDPLIGAGISHTFR